MVEVMNQNSGAAVNFCSLVLYPIFQSVKGSGLLDNKRSRRESGHPHLSACANKVHFYLFRHLWVISLGIQLLQVSEAVRPCVLRDLLDWVNFLEARVPEQTEAGNAKHRVEDINHITRPVRKAPIIRILGSKSV